jgi:hypothetical protein
MVRRCLFKRRCLMKRRGTRHRARITPARRGRRRRRCGPRQAPALATVPGRRRPRPRSPCDVHRRPGRPDGAVRRAQLATLQRPELRETRSSSSAPTVPGTSRNGSPRPHFTSTGSAGTVRSGSCTTPSRNRVDSSPKSLRCPTGGPTSGSPEPPTRRPIGTWDHPPAADS